MARKPAPIVAHRLNAAEHRVLSSFLAGRLPAGQLCAELERARTAPAPAEAAGPAVQPAPASAVAA